MGKLSAENIIDDHQLTFDPGVLLQPSCYLNLWLGETGYLAGCFTSACCKKNQSDALAIADAAKPKQGWKFAG